MESKSSSDISSGAMNSSTLLNQLSCSIGEVVSIGLDTSEGLSRVVEPSVVVVVAAVPVVDVVVAAAELEVEVTIPSGDSAKS